VQVVLGFQVDRYTKVLSSHLCHLQCLRKRLKKKNLSKPFILADDLFKTDKRWVTRPYPPSGFSSFLFGVLEDEIDFSLKHRTRNHFLKEKCCRQ
jgi:hypothetical protein